MDFILNIRTLTTTINEYEKLMTILSEQKANINKSIKELTDNGWSGESKDKFEEAHIKRQELYAKLEADVEAMRSALETEEKPRAVQLKKRSEDFVNCIKRSGSGSSLTSDDDGIISLNGGQFQINNNVDNCTSDYYKRMNSKFDEILNIANNLEYTSFAIGGDVFTAETSIKNQTTSLTDFDDSFNIYCNNVKSMESNICSVFGKISEAYDGISQFGSSSVISPSGEIDQNKVQEVMLKTPEDLTDKEKELLHYVKNLLGEDKYNELNIPLSGDALRDRADVEVFDSKKVYKGEYVKTQAGDDEFILGKAYPNGLGSIFVPCDPSAGIEHAGTFKNHVQSFGKAAMNTVNQMYYDVQIAGDYLDFGIDALTFNGDGILNEKSEISSLNEEKEKMNKFYRDSATYKAAYNADNSIINLTMVVDGIGGIASIPEKMSSIGTGLNNGIKIMNGGNIALEGTKGLEFSVEGIGAVAASGVRALEAGLGVNMMEDLAGETGDVEATKPLVGDGEQYTNGRKNKLKPNIRYKTGEFDYHYETDDLGRIEKLETNDLQFTDRTERLNHSRNTPGKIKGEDDAGHLAGDRFGGSPKVDNLVSQLSNVNKSQYKKIENKWATAIGKGKNVKVNVEVKYDGNSLRPSKFNVQYEIDGRAFSVPITN